MEHADSDLCGRCAKRAARYSLIEADVIPRGDLRAAHLLEIPLTTRPCTPSRREGARGGSRRVGAGAARRGGG